MSDLSLIERLEQHTGAWNSGLDEEIALALGWLEEEDGWHQAGRIFFDDGRLRLTSYAVDLPAYTRSVDAAMTLLPTRIPTTFRLESRYHNGRGMLFAASIEMEGGYLIGIGTSYGHPALAVCAAALRAREYPQ